MMLMQKYWITSMVKRMIDHEKLKTRRGLWKKTEQPGYVKKKMWG